MFVVFGQAQFIFVQADGLLVLVKDVQVSVLEFLRNLEVASFCNVILSEVSPGSAGNVAFDRGADVGRGLVREGVHLVFLDLNDAHDVIPFDGDPVRSTILDYDSEVLIIVDADQ